MSQITELTNNNKVEIIDELLHRNMYKMPDGRQFYEASEKELEHVLYTQTTSEQFCSI